MTGDPASVSVMQHVLMQHSLLDRSVESSSVDRSSVRWFDRCERCRKVVCPMLFVVHASASQTEMKRTQWFTDSGLFNCSTNGFLVMAGGLKKSKIHSPDQVWLI